MYGATAPKAGVLRTENVGLGRDASLEYLHVGVVVGDVCRDAFGPV
jgi:hypothetical protein